MSRPTLGRRLRALWCCAWYGIRPWWMYERVKHHRGGYLDHLAANARHAWALARFLDDPPSLHYEAVVNGAWDSAQTEMPSDCMAVANG